jgi:pSer/pThr/pTyr-binding forkhead associated (FHA) protein
LAPASRGELPRFFPFDKRQAMARFSLRVLDGADRGRVFDGLAPPITIGREEGNTIQLNDERVSRYHIKIQEDHDKLVLTDLESTNGTKVNGEDVQLRILRFGDMITLGRSVLLFGSRDQIASRLAQLRGETAGDATRYPEELGSSSSRSSGKLDFELSWSQREDIQSTMHLWEPPQLPERLSPGQAAQLCELLEYLHLRMRRLLQTVKSEEKIERVTLDTRRWQDLTDLQSRLAEYLREIGEPE